MDEITKAKASTNISQVALAWLLGREGIASVIIGAQKMFQLEDKHGVVEIKLQRGILSHCRSHQAQRKLSQ